jgi:hypothetical protein
VEVPNTSDGYEAVGLPATTGADQFFNPLFPIGQYDGGFPDNLGDQHFTVPPDQQQQHFDLGLSQPSRGVELFDSPVPDFISSQPALNPVGGVMNPWDTPQERFMHTPQSINEWFMLHYASKRNPPLSGDIMSEDRGQIWCKICNPYEMLDPHAYRKHREEMHGVDFETGFQFWAPLDVQPIQGVVGLGYEGYCATCKLWIPLDLSKQDFGWFHHASKVSCAASSPVRMSSNNHPHSVKTAPPLPRPEKRKRRKRRNSP